MTFKCIYPRAVGKEFSFNWKKCHMCPMLKACLLFTVEDDHTMPSPPACCLLLFTFSANQSPTAGVSGGLVSGWVSGASLPPKLASCTGLWPFDTSCAGVRDPWASMYMRTENTFLAAISENFLCLQSQGTSQDGFP